MSGGGSGTTGGSGVSGRGGAKGGAAGSGASAGRGVLGGSSGSGPSGGAGAAGGGGVLNAGGSSGALGVAGGTSSDAGAGGQGGEGGAAVGPPTKNGVPIGDCVDPTPAEQMAAGCPVTQPNYNDPCDTPSLSCRYAVDTNSVTMSSSQTYWVCDASAGWSGEGTQTCWDSCSAPNASTGGGSQPFAIAMTFRTGDCSTRPLTACDPGNRTYWSPPPAQLLADDSLR